MIKVLLIIVVGFISGVLNEEKKAIIDVACENTIISAKCKSNYEYITVIRAMFGRFSLAACQTDILKSNIPLNLINLQCIAQNSTEIVKKRCNNQPDCTIDASVNIFGDPCVGTPKYLEIHYYCEERKATFFEFQSSTNPSSQPITSLFSKVDVLNVTVLTAIPTMVTMEFNGSKKCHSKASRFIMWPSSSIGLTIQQKCPNNALGFANWYCDLHGNWYPPNPDLSECGHKWVIDVENEFFNGRLSMEQSADKLAQYTKNQNDILAGDLRRLVNFISIISIRKFDESISTTSQQNLDLHIMKSLLRASDNILSPNVTASWNDMPLLLRRKSITSLINNIETVQKFVLNSFFNNNNINNGSGEENLTNLVEDLNENFIGSNLDFKIVKLPTPQNPIKRLNVTFKERDDQVHESISIKIHPTNYHRRSDNLGIDMLSIAVIKNLDAIYQDDFFDLANDVLVSNVISLNQIGTILTPSLPNEPQNQSTNFSHKEFHEQKILIKGNDRKIKPLLDSKNSSMTVFLKFPVKTKNNIFQAISYKCVYLDYHNNSNGRWLRDGCEIHEMSTNYVICSCNHLTSFAVLLDVVGVEIPLKHEIALLVITRVGCAISIICLLLSIITFQFFKYHFNERINIHKHLCICLLMAELLFVFGIQAIHNKHGCSVVAVFLHYFFLASFMWMLIEGIQLYTMLVEVFESVLSKIKYYTISAYGIPIIIVLISYGIYPSGYGTVKYCWLTVEKFFIFSFVGPVTIILAANITFLVIALYILAKHFTRMPNHTEKSKFSKIRSWIKGAFILIFLMGLTWFFGLFFVSKETIFAAYLFTILNSFQGVFIFFFHCILNEKVVSEYKKLLKIKNSLASFTKSSSIDSSSSTYNFYKQKRSLIYNQPYQLHHGSFSQHLKNGDGNEPLTYPNFLKLSNRGDWKSLKNVIRRLKPGRTDTHKYPPDFNNNLTLPVVAEEDLAIDSSNIPISNSFLCIINDDNNNNTLPISFSDPIGKCCTTFTGNHNSCDISFQDAELFLQGDGGDTFPKEINNSRLLLLVDHNNNVIDGESRNNFTSTESHLDDKYGCEGVSSLINVSTLSNDSKKSHKRNAFTKNYKCELVTNLDDETTTDDDLIGNKTSSSLDVLENSSVKSSQFNPIDGVIKKAISTRHLSTSQQLKFDDDCHSCYAHCSTKSDNLIYNVNGDTNKIISHRFITFPKNFSNNNNNQHLLESHKSSHKYCSISEGNLNHKNALNLCHLNTNGLSRKNSFTL